MNDDTFDEVVTFKVTRLSVYIGISTLFVLLVGLTLALIVFTPLKLYIPGYGEGQKAGEFEMLKVRTDSLEHDMMLKQQYFNSIENVLKGKILPMDTSRLPLKVREKSNE
jgi:hypothetical protein